ncbi:hypothetical protein J1N35_037967 [Gossypium stocksii]|uniref:Uncharacterized protein n=1 Tax=Gossypium stocksii TaxID=47602 RepID=A0A9D3UL97_9ROSI|nr:hypothetical protein J1N35_037967 [Gossypium stocksii]
MTDNCLYRLSYLLTAVKLYGMKFFISCCCNVRNTIAMPVLPLSGCLSFDCQGAGRPLATRALREFIKRHCPSIVFPMGTKQRKGGLYLRWNNEMDLKSLEAQIVEQNCGNQQNVAEGWNQEERFFREQNA